MLVASEPAAFAAAPTLASWESDVATAARALAGADRMPLVVVGAWAAELAAGVGVALASPPPGFGRRATNQTMVKSSVTPSRICIGREIWSPIPQVVGRFARFR